MLPRDLIAELRRRLCAMRDRPASHLREVEAGGENLSVHNLDFALIERVYEVQPLPKRRSDCA